jgi:hypothetical protein
MNRREWGIGNILYEILVGFPCFFLFLSPSPSTLCFNITGLLESTVDPFKHSTFNWISIIIILFRYILGYTTLYVLKRTACIRSCRHPTTDPRKYRLHFLHLEIRGCRKKFWDPLSLLQLLWKRSKYEYLWILMLKFVFVILIPWFLGIDSEFQSFPRRNYT